MIRRFRRLAPLVLVASSTLLAACGSNNPNDIPYRLTGSYAIVGQKDSTSDLPDGGNFVPSANTIAATGGAAENPASTEFFLPDTSNNRVLVFTPTAPRATSPSGNDNASAVIGQSDFTTATAQPPAASGAQTFNGLRRPTGVAVGTSLDGTHTYYAVADTGNNRVLLWTTSDPASGTAADVVLGQADFSSIDSNRGSTAAANTLSAPGSVSITSTGKLVIADTGNNRVLIWKTIPSCTAAAPACNAPGADLVLGQADFTSTDNTFPYASDNSTTQTRILARMNQPLGLWSDGSYLLVADTSNNRVLVYTSFPSVSDPIPNFFLGQSNLTVAPAASSATGMSGPTSVWSDGFRIFVADKGNNRVIIFDQFPTANGVAANRVLGQQNMTNHAANDDNGDRDRPQDGFSETHPTGRTLNGPTGVFYDIPNQKVYVTDSGNNRLMIYDGTNLPVPGNN